MLHRLLQSLSTSSKTIFNLFYEGIIYACINTLVSHKESISETLTKISLISEKIHTENSKENNETAAQNRCASSDWRHPFCNKTDQVLPGACKQRAVPGTVARAKL